jgi:hypothetical protein
MDVDVEQPNSVPLLFDVLAAAFGGGGVLLMLHWLAAIIPILHGLRFG